MPVSSLLADGRYPYGPDLTEYMDSFTAIAGQGQLRRPAVLPDPETGEYTFWVWSDDDSLRT
jgi:hypothetical protein